MSTNVTDRVILKEIYKMYYSEFCAYSDNPSNRECKIYVPIDCRLIAQKLKLDPDIVFGRLYYHLEKKHGYKQGNGALVQLFSMKTGSDVHTVNFPLLSAILAEHEQSFLRFSIPLVLSVIALCISIAAYVSNT